MIQVIYVGDGVSMKGCLCLCVLLSAFLLFGFPIQDSKVSAEGSYVFYGFAPLLVENSTRVVDEVAFLNYSLFPARLDIVGISDGTKVEVYNLTGRRLLADGTLDRMDLMTVYIGREATNLTSPPFGGTYFKVISDKLVAVCISGVREDYGFSTFHPGVGGGFVDEEFIVMANPTWGMSLADVPEKGFYQVIFALEDSHVEIYTENGTEVANLDLMANAVGKVFLDVASTGRIMIGGLSTESFVQLPSATGGFVGRAFYGSLPGHIHSEPGRTDKQSWIVLAGENGEISVYDLRKPEWQISLSGPEFKKNVEKDELLFCSAENSSYTTARANIINCGVPLRIDSTCDASILLGKGAYHSGTFYLLTEPELLGDDISIAGARAGETFSFYAPTRAVLFAPQNVTVTVDESLVSLREDEYLDLYAGVHKIISDGPVIIEILGHASNSLGDDVQMYKDTLTWYVYDSWGTYLLSIQGLEATFPAPPEVGTGIVAILLYGGIGVAILVFGLVLLVTVRRRRTS